MDIIKLIEKINDKGISINLVGQDLNIAAPKGVIDNAIISEIKTYKHELISILSTSIIKAEIKDSYPLTPSQNRFWFLSLTNESSLAYNMSESLQLNGTVNYKILEETFLTLINRHEILRTVFKEINDDARQCIVPMSEIDFKIMFEDLSGKTDQDILIRQRIEAEYNTAFDLKKAPLIRVKLLKVAEDSHILVYTLHHIIGDGWSMKLLAYEFIYIYNELIQKRKIQLSELTLQFKDYSEWINKKLATNSFIAEEQYWLKKFDNIPANFELPKFKPRPLVKSFNGSVITKLFDNNFRLKLQSFCEQQGATLFMGLIAGINGLFYRYTGQYDITLGVPVAGREHKDVENLIGVFINTLAIRTQFDPKCDFITLLNIQKKELLDAYSHQSYPFDLLVDKLKLERDISRSPLFDISVSFQNYHNALENKSLNLEGINVTPYQGFDRSLSQFDLTLDFCEVNNCLHLRAEFSTNIFEEIFINDLIRNLQAFIEKCIENPSQKIGEIDYLSSEDKNKIISEFNNTKTEFSSDKTIIDLFEEQVKKTTDGIAIIIDNVQMTYKELNIRSNQLARTLVKKGIKTGNNIGLVSQRNFNMIIGLLGILKAGATYIPIDPDYPKSRKEYIIRNSDIQYIIVESDQHNLTFDDKTCIIKIQDEEILEEDSNNLSLKLNPANIAYIIYTSGSTGLPKGVMIRHDSAVNLIEWVNKKFNISNNDRLLSVSSMCFDLSVYDFLGILASGAAVVIAKEDDLYDYEKLKDILKTQRITFWNSVPTTLKLLLDEINQSEKKDTLKDLRLIFLSGDWIPVTLPDQAKKYFPKAKIISLGGATEGTIWSNYYPIDNVDDSWQSIPYGRPINNNSFYILDKNLHPVPYGVQGELYIGGIGVAKGYANDKEKTSASFMKDPFCNIADRIMYKTGDLGRMLYSNNMEFLGRMDRQVKINGFRIELGEIENVIRKYDNTIKDVFISIDKSKENPFIIAYIVLINEIDKINFTAYISDNLPNYMIPDRYIYLDKIPLNPNGKADIKKLEEIEKNTSQSLVPLRAENHYDKKLITIWERILKIQDIKISDNFFRIGGHSLLATKVVTSIKQEFKVNFEIKDLFLHPTIIELSDILQSKEKINRSNIFNEERPQQVPLSFQQEGLWFIDKLLGSQNYHIPSLLRIKGNLNCKILEKAINALINRHEILRTVFIEDEDGIPYQKALPKNNWKLNYSLFDKSKTIDEYFFNIIYKKFNLSKDYMLRANLVQLADEEYLLLIVMHHIASDGWSITLFIKELLELYKSIKENKKPQLIPLPIQYADYANWQRKTLRDELLDNKLNYWINRLKGVEPLNLPTDFSRPAIQSMKGASLVFKLNKQIFDNLTQFSLNQDATIFMTLLSAFYVLLYKYTEKEDICVGIPMANRTDSNVEPLIGYFINVIALRADLSNNLRFMDVLLNIKEESLKAYENQDVPFEKIVEKLGLQRSVDKSPLFQVIFALQNNENVDKIELDALSFSNESLELQTSKFDLTFNIFETPDGLNIEITYCSDLFLESSINLMFEHYKELILSILEDPSQKINDLRIISNDERYKIQLSGTYSIDYPKNKTIVELFEEQVAKSPNEIALIYEDQKLTYCELNERSNQMAHYLMNKGVCLESLVVICMGRSIDAMIAIIGIIKTGAAFIPVDPSYPKDRINGIIEDSGTKYVIVNQNSESFISSKNEIDCIVIDSEEKENIFRNKCSNLQTSLHPQNLIYLIYTSGSTGKPKGAMIEHQALVDHIFGMFLHGNFLNCKSFLLTSSLAADGGHSIIFGCLLSGGTLHVLSEDSLLDNLKFKRYLDKHEIDCIKTVPSLWLSFAQDKLFLLPEKMLILGGEIFSLKILNHLKELKFKGIIFNNYGPTETTIGKLMHSVDINKHYENIPIGKPFSNTVLYVVNKNNQLCPEGIPGELWIGGDGVARGYLNRQELTQDKFIKDPFVNSGKNLYKTGDYVKWLPDGNLEFLGRIDFQIKIRGHRIELGEIETTLQQCESVDQCVILSDKDANGDTYLIAYIVPNGEFKKDHIREYLKSQLPDHMIPALLIEISKMPLTKNGKADAKALKSMGLPDLSDTIKAQPVNDLQEQILSIWNRLLKIDSIGIFDNFFELGGHSLLATRVVSAIRKDLNKEITIKDIFLHPTISELSVIIEKSHKQSSLPQLIKNNLSENIPLSFSQERLWFIDKMQGSINYHIPVILKIEGKLNITALEKSFKELINRHKILKTIYKEIDGTVYQKIKQTDSWVLEYSEKTDADSTIEKIIDIETYKLFDLSKDFMIRARIIKDSKNGHILIIVIHHIASDGWSMPIFTKELIELYTAITDKRQPNLPEIKIQYKDFAIWQRENVKGEVLDEQLSYWEDKLEGVEQVNLPLDFLRPSIQSTKGSSIHLTINKEISEALNTISKQEGVSLFITLLSIFKILLYKYSGQTDICIGTSIANRTEINTESLIGFFVNTIALRDDLGGNPTFKELLHRVKQTAFDAYDYQNVPFEMIVSKIVKERDMSKSPLFQIMFELHNNEMIEEIDIRDVKFSHYPINHNTSKFDLSLNIVESEKGLDISIEYCTDLFTRETIQFMLGHYEILLSFVISGINQNIDTIKMITQYEENLILGRVTSTSGVYFNEKEKKLQNNIPINTRFEQIVNFHKDKTAIIHGSESLTYEAVNTMSNQIGHCLYEIGVKKGECVGVFLSRDPILICCILGILKSGAIYVPLDTQNPPARINQMLHNTQISTLITTSELVEILDPDKLKNILLVDEYDPNQIKKINNSGIGIRDKRNIDLQPESNLLNQNNMESWAYVLFTSGSTGEPKGAITRHNGAINHIFAEYEAMNLDDDFRFLQSAEIGSDISIWQMLAPLLKGGIVVIIDKIDLLDVNKTINILEETKISLVELVPSYVRVLIKYIKEMDLPPLFNDLKWIMLTGEESSITLLNELISMFPHIKYLNAYGPCEASDDVIQYVIESKLPTNQARLPIGRPITNMNVAILDEKEQLSPIGVIGEICITGIGVGAGYIHDMQKTSVSFIDNPFDEMLGNKLYKTGDLGRWLPDGNLEFWGRKDNQVKIRGNRVELGEIEAVIIQEPYVEGVCLTTLDSRDELIAVIVPMKKESKDQSDIESMESNLRVVCQNKIPKYMQPDHFIFIDEFPINNSHKIDKNKLMALIKNEEIKMKVNISNTYVAPRNQQEKTMVNIWKETLNIDQVGIYDNFFELGGHSLLVVRIINEIKNKFFMEIPISSFFSNVCIADLCNYIQSTKEDEAEHNVEYDLLDL